MFIPELVYLFIKRHWFPSGKGSTVPLPFPNLFRSTGRIGWWRLFHSLLSSLLPPSPLELESQSYPSFSLLLFLTSMNRLFSPVLRNCYFSTFKFTFFSLVEEYKVLVILCFLNKSFTCTLNIYLYLLLVIVSLLLLLYLTRVCKYSYCT